MLTDEQVKLIREKMKKTNTYSATFARRLNLTRQGVNIILNQKGTSKRVETYLLEWLNEK